MLRASDLGLLAENPAFNDVLELDAKDDGFDAYGGGDWDIGGSFPASCSPRRSVDATETRSCNDRGPWNAEVARDADNADDAGARTWFSIR